MKRDPELSDEDIDIVQRHIATFWRNGRCPYCESDQWSIGGYFTQMQKVLRGNGLMEGHYGLVMIALTCETCGQITFLNSKILRVPASVVRKP
jgi:hypothetical protein